MGYANNILESLIEQHLKSIAQEVNMGVLAYYGPISPTSRAYLTDELDKVDFSADRPKDLLVILQTPGGSAEFAEYMVEAMRSKFVGEVTFVVPDFAMSAGTILCMSGDHILMSYKSRLGPTDPQIQVGNSYVPALGYLDQVEAIIARTRENGLDGASALMLQKVDLAELQLYIEARELSNDLLVQWLTKYKFKNWNTHQTTEKLKGQDVTPAERAERAKQIATKLSSNKEWHSHGRMISREKLIKLQLQIDDLDSPQNQNLKQLLSTCQGLILEHMDLLATSTFIKVKTPSL